MRSGRVGAVWVGPIWGLLLVAAFSACSSDDAAPEGAPAQAGSSGVSSVAGESSHGDTAGGEPTSQVGAGGTEVGAGGVGAAGESSAVDCGRAEQACCPGFACDGALRCRGGACVQLDVSDFGSSCQVDAECSGGICLPDPAGDYRCTAACQVDDDCVAGWVCGAAETPAGRACACQAGPETCNGLDDDCNGVIDDASVTQPLCAAEIGDGGVCQGGECSCGGLMCDALCVDPQHDPDNCGTCDTRCEIACAGGACTVPTAVAVGEERACALLSDTSVRCWGFNNGALGDGTTFDRQVPTPIGLTGVVELALGQKHGCAVLGNGTLHCWGNSGLIGIGSAGGGRTPTLVPGLTEVAHVSVGDTHTCVVLKDETVSCWGFNLEGELGFQRVKSIEPSPVAVPGLSHVLRLALGDEHSCALMEGGAVECWGKDDHGQLGDNGNASRFAPQAVPGLSNVKDLASGSNHTCALLDGGTVQCWGANEVGQLGDGSKQDRPQPTPAKNLTGVVRLWAGGSVSLAQTSTTFRGWGLSLAGADTVIDSIIPDPNLALGVPAADGVAAAVNGYGGCIVGKDKPTRCWGLRPSDMVTVQW